MILQISQTQGFRLHHTFRVCKLGHVTSNWCLALWWDFCLFLKASSYNFHQFETLCNAFNNFLLSRFGWIKRGRVQCRKYLYSIHSLFFHSCSHSCTSPLNPFTYPGQPPFQWRKALLPFNRFSFIYLLRCSRSSDIRRRVRAPPLPRCAPTVRRRSHTGTCNRAHAPASWHPARGTRTGTWAVMLHSRCGLKERKKGRRK